MIDLHCHVLPGIDDGPPEIEGSIALADAAIAAGISTLVATPHVNARTANDAATITRLTSALNRRLAAAGMDLEIIPGAEIAMTHIAEIESSELAQLSLGGGGWLLVEPPFTPVATGLERLLLDLQRQGYGVVLAHPERCPALQRDRGVVPSLVQAGVLMSITAGSLVGRFGSEVRGYSLELARGGLIHNVTSDAHDSVRRPPGLAQAMEQAGLASLADWLTRDVPAAIVTGSAIPPRPAGVPLASAPTGWRRWLQRH